MQDMDNFWWYITLSAGPGEEEVLHSLADMTGSIGAEFRDLPEGAKLRAYYRSSEDLSHWKNALMQAMLPWSSIEIEDFGKIENQPWNVVSEEAFPPLPVGEKLVVLAPWHKGDEPDDRIALYINPGSAFGTGYHESTQIALELLEQYIKEEATTADIGTGSGILTIGALKMGARKAYARDIDPTVIEEVRKNFELNALDESGIDLAVGDLLAGFTHKVDILTANILLEPLSTMIKDVPGVLRADGAAIFSGMLQTEKAIFLKALSEAGMQPVQEHVKGDWWGVVAKASA
ncbi:50S ribosomal protein L11 methyltransferase [Synergistaceae bacterium OttesenSCG-928-D05]|nr:50S ribosomal protein L11 methyltransferase [Synergistaceae bacterium OttesenSCG-928-D05]